MKINISTPLAQYLDWLGEAGSDVQYGLIDLFTFTLLNGTSLRVANWDVNVFANAKNYLASGPYIERTKIRTALKAEVTQISLTLHANPIMTVNNTPILQAIAAGQFGGATVSVDRLFVPYPSVWTATGGIYGGTYQQNMRVLWTSSLSGTCTTSGNTAAAATGTFTGLQPGDSITIGGVSFTVARVAQSGSVLITAEYIGTNTTAVAWSAVTNGIYRSKQPDNIGNQPDTSPTWWQRMPSITTPFTPLDSSLGTINQFVGQVAEIEELDRSHAKLSVKCPLALLSTQHPRNLYLTGCDHVLFDPGCGLSPTNFQAAGQVQAGATKTTIPTVLTQPGPLPAPTTSQFGQNNLTWISASNNGINAPAATYYVVVTFSGASGESLPSAEYSDVLTGGGQQGTTNKVLAVTSPTSWPAGAQYWNVYVGLASGEEQLQQARIPLGGNNHWIQSVGGTLATGAPPPTIASGGYFGLGTITFTSGVLAGLTYTITGYTNPTGTAGQITVTPPMLQAPAAGDSFIAVAGCDKSMVVCDLRFGNLANYSGTPFVPDVSQSI